MSRTELITMTLREADRIKTIQAVVDREMRPALAAERLALSTRHIALASHFRLLGRSWRSSSRHSPASVASPSGASKPAFLNRPGFRGGRLV